MSEAVLSFEKFIFKKCLELGVLLRNQLELLYSIRKEIGVGPPWAPFHIFFIIHPRKKNVNQNDVELDFSIGHALVLFQFFLNNKQKMYGGICTSPWNPPEIHIFWC